MRIVKEVVTKTQQDVECCDKCGVELFIAEQCENETIHEHGTLRLRKTGKHESSRYFLCIDCLDDINSIINEWMEDTHEEV